MTYPLLDVTLETDQLSWARVLITLMYDNDPAIAGQAFESLLVYVDGVAQQRHIRRRCPQGVN